MHMNWKARFRNKTFLLALISSVLLLVQQSGFNNVFPDNIMDIVNTILFILMLLGIVVDPTTPSIGDDVTKLPIEGE